MSRSAREAHEDGDCGWHCIFCQREEDRERARQEAEAATADDGGDQ